MSYTTVSKIKNEIERAFGNDRFPKGENITKYKSYEEEECLESREIEEFLSQMRWQDLSYDLLASSYQGDYTALHNFLTDRAFEYFLPAFLIIILEHYDCSDLLADNIVSVLAYGRGRGDNDDKNKDMKPISLNKEKVEALVHFLNYINKTHGDDFEGEIDLALRNLSKSG